MLILKVSKHFLTLSAIYGSCCKKNKEKAHKKIAEGAIIYVYLVPS